MKKNIWQEKGIPVLPKAPLLRVCDLVGCEANDLLTMCSYGMIWIKRRIQEEVATAWILCDKGFESRVMELLTSTPFSSLSLGYELIRIDLLSEPKQIKEDIYADTESSLIEIDVRASGEFILRPLGYMSSKSINEVDPDSLIKLGGTQN